MMNETAILVLPKSSVYRDFWKEFRLFASPFEELSFRCWYLVLLAFCVILTILDINLDLRQGIDLPYVLSNGGDYYKRVLSFTKYDLTNAPLLFAIIAFPLVALTFSLWCRSVPVLFWRLYTLGRIFSRQSKRKVGQEEYLRFLAQYQQALFSRRRYLVLGIFLLFVLGLMLIVVPPQIAAVVSTPAPDKLSVALALIRWPLLLIVCASLAAAYYAALGLWVMAVTGWYVIQLALQFHLLLHPQHPDHCGGLKLLGRFCFGMALPILTASCFLGIYGIAAALLTQGTNTFVGFANLLLFLFTLLLAGLAFFAPLWNIHHRMVAWQIESDEACSLLFLVLEAKLRTALHHGEIEKARSARDELELAQVLYPKKVKLPIWPFDRRIFLAYVLLQLVPLLSLLVAMNANGLIASAFKGLWGLVSGSPVP
jgi:hypothetical protein